MTRRRRLVLPGIVHRLLGARGGGRGTRGAIVCTLMLACAALARAAATETVPAVPSGEWLVARVKALTAPDMDGRRSGTPGADRAARVIADAFKDAGLTPGGDQGFFQAFDVPTGLRLGADNRMDVTITTPVPLVLGHDWVPLPVSTDGVEESEVVFVGYGITAPDLAYDDYAGLDVRGKVVLAMTREPRGHDPGSPFRRPDAYHYSERSHKVVNARQHGARAILMVAHPGASTDALPPLTGITQSWGIVGAGITRPVADRLLASSGQDLATLASAIDRAMAPRSRTLPGTRVKVAVSLVREHGTAANVVGVLPGTDATLSGETIVVGAHYDHLGHGGEGSLAPDAHGQVHHGADDNASGVAAVMGLARAFARAGGLPRTLVFVTFAGEEMGLLGSSHYVRHPARPLDRTVLMVNLDMVGRLADKLYVGGADTGTGVRRRVEHAARTAGVATELRGDPFARSDHTSFYAAARPVLFFFTGAHADYHRPSDTWEKINGAGLERVTRLAADVIASVARERAAPAYVRVDTPASGPPRGGYGPFFGVVPEFAKTDRPGVRVAGVRPGSPAEKAGVRTGDVIVRFGEVDVHTLEHLTFALRAQRAGDRVGITLIRDGTEQRVEATLEERR